MSRWTTTSWPFMAATCSGVRPREPQAEPNGTKGRNNIFWHLKSQSFGNCGTGTWPTGTVVCGKMRELPGRNFASTNLVQRNLDIHLFLGHQENLKATPRLASLLLVFSCDRPNMAKLENEIKKLRFKSRDIKVLKLSHEFTSDWRL